MNLKQHSDPQEISDRNIHCFLLEAGFALVRIATCLPEAALSAFHLICPSARLGALGENWACVGSSVSLCSSLPCPASCSDFPRYFHFSWLPWMPCFTLLCVPSSFPEVEVEGEALQGRLSVQWSDSQALSDLLSRQLPAPIHSCLLRTAQALPSFGSSLSIN